MKTTLELPDQLFRDVKATAASKGIKLKDFVTEALTEKLKADMPSPASKSWMIGYGALSDLREETLRIEAAIEQAFEQFDAEDRA